MSEPSPKKPAMEFLGAYVDRRLKADLRRIARSERRSVNAQVVVFLTEGMRQLQAATTGRK